MTEAEIQHLRELMEVKERALKSALDLQAREYERRLEGLNHESERILAAAAKSVGRDVYDADQRGHSTRLDTLARDMESIRREISVDMARRAGRTEAIAVFAMVLSLLLPLLLKVFFPY